MRYKRDHKFVWAKIDYPLPIGVQHSFLYGLRKLLLTWGFDKRAIAVDEIQMLLKIGDCQVVNTEVINGKFICNLRSLWLQWKDFQNDTDVKNLLQVAADKSSKGPPPGKGKGKKSNGIF